MHSTPSRPARLGALLLGLTAWACGGGSSGDSSGDGGAGVGSSSGSPKVGSAGSGFRAKIDGKRWEAEPIGVTARAGGVPGGLVLVGSQSASGMSQSISISLAAVTGPGTYALGVGPGVIGGTASVGEAPLGTGNGNAWETELNGLSGTVQIIKLDTTKIVGTVAFTATAGKRNTIGGTRTVTEGEFDLPLKGTLPPVPPNVGSKVSATLGGRPYNAWAVNTSLQDFMGGAGVNISTTSSENTLSLMLVGVTAPGTYAISNTGPQRFISAGRNGTPECCWGQNGNGETGTINITSLSPARIKGTFSATLRPSPGKPATAPLMITDGVFDVGVD